MSTTTTNYGLIKPDTTDPILVGQLNDNADVIDATLKSLSDALDVAKLGIKYKGEVNYYSNLPSSGNQIGDAYTVKYAGSSGTTPDGTEYVWGTVSGTNQWINFSKDSYTKAEVDALLALKQNALTTAQLAAVNSGIDSTKVEQIETNKNNILSLYTQGVKNIAKPNTISAISGITIVQNLGHYEISGTTGGSQYTAYLCTPTEDIIATEELYIPAAATRTNVSYLCHWKNTRDESQYSIIGTGLIIPQGCKIHAIYMQVAANTTFSLNVDMMICKKAIYDADNSYQPYALSNAELTALVLKVASVTYSLNDLTWTASLDGMIYSNATFVNGITSIYSAIITGFARLRATDVIIPILSNDGTQIRFMANTGSWVTDAEIKLRIVGI